MAVILLVHDNSAVRSIVADMLASLGHSPIEAENGSAGLCVVEQGGIIDLVITDEILRGGMSCVDFANRVRASRPGIPILFMTDTDASPLGNAICKPFGLSKLARSIETIRADLPARRSDVPEPGKRTRSRGEKDEGKESQSCGDDRLLERRPYPGIPHPP